MSCITQWAWVSQWIHLGKSESYVNILLLQAGGLHLIWCFAFRKECCTLFFDHICQVPRWKNLKGIDFIPKEFSTEQMSPFHSCFSRFENQRHIGLYKIILFFLLLPLEILLILTTHLDSDTKKFVLILPLIHPYASKNLLMWAGVGRWKWNGQGICRGRKGGMEGWREGRKRKSLSNLCYSYIQGGKRSSVVIKVRSGSQA